MMWGRRYPIEVYPVEIKCRTPFHQEYYTGMKRLNGKVVLHPTDGSGEILIAKRIEVTK